MAIQLGLAHYFIIAVYEQLNWRVKQIQANADWLLAGFRCDQNFLWTRNQIECLQIVSACMSERWLSGKIYFYLGCDQSKRVGLNWEWARTRRKQFKKTIQKIHFPIRKADILRTVKRGRVAKYDTGWTSQNGQSVKSSQAEKRRIPQLAKRDQPHPRIGLADQEALLSQEKQAKHQQSRDKEDCARLRSLHVAQRRHLLA